MFPRRLQEKAPIFAVTAIFGPEFLTNLPKFQKYHFFSHGIYIIIEDTDGWRRAETGRGTASLEG